MLTNEVKVTTQGSSQLEEQLFSSSYLTGERTRGLTGYSWGTRSWKRIVGYQSTVSN